MAFTHLVIFRRRRLLVKVLQVTLVDRRHVGKQSARDVVVGVVGLIKEPHGITRLRVFDDRKGIVPHAFAQVRARSVNVLELRTRIFVGMHSRTGPQGGQNDKRHLHLVVGYWLLIETFLFLLISQTPRDLLLWL